MSRWMFEFEQKIVCSMPRTSECPVCLLLNIQNIHHIPTPTVPRPYMMWRIYKYYIYYVFCVWIHVYSVWICVYIYIHMNRLHMFHGYMMLKLFWDTLDWEVAPTNTLPKIIEPRYQKDNILPLFFWGYVRHNLIQDVFTPNSTIY